MAEVVDLETQIATTPAATIAGAAAQVETALMLLLRDEAQGRSAGRPTERVGDAVMATA